MMTSSSLPENTDAAESGVELDLLPAAAPSAADPAAAGDDDADDEDDADADSADDAGEDEDFDDEDFDDDADDLDDAGGNDNAAGDAEPTRCGFVAILGAPNAGKSTLVNRLVGTKVTIVSPKVQTTRNRVMGIAIRGAAQVIFVDTPGIFAPRRRLDRAMVDAAWSGANDADQIAVMVDAHRGITPEVEAIFTTLKKQQRKVTLILNKIDLVRRESLLALAAACDSWGIFDRVFMVSAENGDRTDDLLKFFAGLLPDSPWLFPEDQVSDLPMRLMAAEITREQLFRQLHQELPYALAVETDQWQERDDGSVRIDQTIYVQRESQKAIVLGKSGRQVKAVGERARTELEGILEQRVHLFLHVKVKENFLDERQHYREMGLNFDV